MPAKLDLNDLISQKEAADIRGISVQAINSLVKRGRLTTITIGGKIFLSRREVERYEPGTAGRPKKERVKEAKKSAKAKRKA